MKNKEKVNRLWKTMKILLVVLLLLVITVGSQRTDIDETSTTYSEIGEYSTIFYNNTGNDSVYYFDSDPYGTHLLTLDGSSGNVTVDRGNLTVSRNLTAGNITGDYYYGNGTYLTGIASYDTGAGLNLTGTTFSINGSIFHDNLDWDGKFVNASGSGGGNPFNQSLNTTDNVIFENVTTKELYVAESPYEFVMYFDINGTLTWEMMS